MAKTIGTISNEGFSCVIREDNNGRVYFTADGDIDADGVLNMLINAIFTAVKI